MGVIPVGGERSMIDVWSLIHAHARAWPDLKGKRMAEDRAAYNARDREVLSGLADVDAERWKSMCAGCGWTVHGAVGLSWCKNTG